VCVRVHVVCVEKVVRDCYAF